MAGWIAKNGIADDYGWHRAIHKSKYRNEIMSISPKTNGLIEIFNPLERRLFRYTAVLLSSVVMVLLLVIVFWAFSSLFSMFGNLLFPLAIAGILALILFPVVDFLQRHLHVGRVLTIVLVFSVLSLVAVGGAILIVPIATTQVLGFAEAAPDIFSRLEENISYYFPSITPLITDRIENGLFEGAGASKADGMGESMMNLMGFIVGLAFVPLYLFFALLSGEKLRGRATELLSVFAVENQTRILYFIDTFVGYVTAFFRGQLVIASIMAVMYAAGFTLAGLKLAIPIGILLGLLNVVPFLGTLLGLVLVLPMAYLQAEGGIGVFVFTLLVFAAVQLIEAWVLTPRIMADRSGLPPVLVVISVFFWGIALGGVTGMVLAVPLSAFFVAIWGQIKTGVTRSLSLKPD